MRISTGHRARGLLAAIALSCGGHSADTPSGFDVAAEFARVTSLRAELSSSRARLDGMSAPPRGDDPAALRDAQAAFDASYARSQRALARFLTVALNEAPSRPETRNALDLYAADAEANARYVRDHDGAPGPALRDLMRARRAYVGLGVPVPPGLDAALAELEHVPAPTPAAAGAPVPPAGRGGAHRGRARSPASGGGSTANPR
ncbi:MAG TPA: hypothetical protein VMT19_12705 [Thermoanaerobaculaceae bacterium]|nr:hypothetical protein [Thermoanaerobaculaceae bacterium]